MLKCTGLQ